MLLKMILFLSFFFLNNFVSLKFPIMFHFLNSIWYSGNMSENRGYFVENGLLLSPIPKFRVTSSSEVMKFAKKTTIALFGSQD